MTEMKILQENPLLEKYADKLKQRQHNFQKALNRIIEYYGSVDNFTISYKHYGLHRIEGGIFYREWVPNAKNVYLAGDFNGWNLTDPATKCDRDQYGVFTLFLPDVKNNHSFSGINFQTSQKNDHFNQNGETRIKHNTRVRCFIELNSGELLSRVPAWINYTTQNKQSGNFDGVFWDPPQKYEFKHPWPEPRTDCAFLIYECHIGMAGPEPRIHTFSEFTQNVIPYVKNMGYNAIQLMGIMEHSFYASAGYQVTSFFAPSSRFGTPEELKHLIDTAHSLGIYVFLDTIHSHASKNIGEGLNFFDGTESQYFHSGTRGIHPVWDSRLFDYSNIEVQRFLLSNLRYYIDEFHFDGFRFDGVGSMIYVNQGNNVNFNWDVYFSDLVDEDAVTYLYLANYVIHRYDMFAITIAEDVSGMIGIARSFEDGGFGFDFRLNMGGADLWVQTLEKYENFTDWNMNDIVYKLNNRPFKEKTISYTECHDQPFPIAFRLLGNNAEEKMSFLSKIDQDKVDDSISLLKLIRLLTFGISGESYLTFMGNEFCHPGIIEFPHQYNHDSFQNCIRKFELANDEMTRYASLKRFDHDMLYIEHKEKFLNCGDLGYISAADKENMVVAFERKDLVFIFNFNSNKDFESYYIGVEKGGKYKCIFSTDDFKYAGKGRIAIEKEIMTEKENWGTKSNRIEVKLLARTAFILKSVDIQENM
ncbi:1,4-alpha-glucan-branching enzyme [Tritrichomonas foetus]|uniref:1,4-alpha-glucan branching enzyme n=1 Tax=Tritrichomonas foetus TaxID=1144522 RepID=A0A1J4JVA4_9EUKA|nr:1,4-alpha-glucan-branching enzyme [Tritrichomonas foetus]|eukprot:OHT01460.1 1,4-alpha-glucan-branching enzyme [Tritrichomonas foetus]